MEDVAGYVYLSEVIPAGTMTAGSAEDKYDVVPLWVKRQLVDYWTFEDGLTKVMLGGGYGAVRVVESPEEVAKRVHAAGNASGEEA